MESDFRTEREYATYYSTVVYEHKVKSFPRFHLLSQMIEKQFILFRLKLLFCVTGSGQGRTSTTTIVSTPCSLSLPSRLAKAGSRKYFILILQCTVGSADYENYFFYTFHVVPNCYRTPILKFHFFNVDF